ncbi:MAG: response regulator [Cyanobacteria bacterium P01_F01_bin.4]
MSQPLTPKSVTGALTASIMVIDDTPANLRLLLKLLTEQGYRVRPVAEGALALTAAQLDPPDLILLDIKMPDLDGYEVCKRLKADARTRDIPVIFLTVLDEVIDVVRGFELGGVDYITKPVRSRELLARIDNQVRLRSLQKQLMAQEQFLRGIYDGVEAAISVMDGSLAWFADSSTASLLVNAASSASSWVIRSSWNSRTTTVS